MPHILKLHPSFGPVKSKTDHYLEIEGTSFQCPDKHCKDLTVRFGDPPLAIYTNGTLMNDTYIQCLVPKYTKPDVLHVEITLNGRDYTSDKKQYGYFDPYVLNAKPRLIAVDGSSIVQIIGFGFVKSGETQALINGEQSDVTCNGQ